VWLPIHYRAMTPHRAPSSPALWVATQGPPCGAARLDLAAGKALRRATPPDSP
jgi:hypothetical protein